MDTTTWAQRHRPETGPEAVVLGVWEPATPAAATRSRRELSAALDPGAGSAGAVERLLLCHEELTSNALRHGRAPYHVRLLPGAAKLRIEVDDGGGEPARRRAPSDQGGRGLLLLERCAAAWGQLRRPSGKTLWVELVTDDPAGACG
jgi:hypothetical protein